MQNAILLHSSMIKTKDMIFLKFRLTIDTGHKTLERITYVLPYEFKLNSFYIVRRARR